MEKEKQTKEVEWINLMMEAKKTGISIQEVRNFLKTEKKRSKLD